ncbi:MAG: magnesium chelatase [Rhodospirillales bacterium 20-64-7]|nr:MAG: magnesium chelatase [Rhodospirillales bacterium 20-64-7]
MDRNPATVLRLAIVTMDSHLAAAAGLAESRLQGDFPGLILELHSADQFGTDKAALAACHAAIAQADIVICTMMFLEDHVRLVADQLAARRDGCDAMFCALSAASLVKQTRFGRLDMANEPGGALGLLKRLKGKRQGNAKISAGESQMRLLRNLPKILRFIPGTAQDLRVYFLAMQYWLAGSAENVEGLVRLLVGRYAAGPRVTLRQARLPAAPIEYPDMGLYHPRAEGRIVCEPGAIPHCLHARGTIGLLLLRSYLLAGDTAHYDGVIGAIEAEGFNVLPIFATGLDQRGAIQKYFLTESETKVDAVASLTGFSLVGGPAYNDSAAAEAVLAALDVPYICAAPLEFQTLDDWERDARGMTPVEATLMIALPELDGGTLPMIFGGRRAAGTALDQRRMCVHPERAARLAARLARLVRLRQRARAERRIGIVLFNFPPNAGAAGSAAYLSVFASLFNTLQALSQAGYTVTLPANVDALRNAVLGGNAAAHGTAANVGAKIPRDAHIAREPHLAEIEKVWGPAPGRDLTDGANLFVLGASFGNVFVGLQPPFGYEGDPMRLLFEGGFAPTHAFAAFYRWLGEEFGADALLHFGTHGALEFMPGKQNGLSAKCWPDRLIGNLPNFYLYAANNPSEGMLAKRRGMATLVSHLTPPVAAAGLYKGLAELKVSLERARALPPQAPAAERAALAALVQAQAAALDLCPAEPGWGLGAAGEFGKLAERLLELEYTLIPEGLHIVGAPPDAAARDRILDAAGITDVAERTRIGALLAADSELPAIVTALDGRYIRPAPGGDLLRNPAILPTGRNLYGFDPFRMPTEFAVRDGAAQAELLLARHAAEGKGLPETVALLLWGSDNLKSEGGPLAQALWLMGAAPRRDGYGRLCGAELVPLARLSRPRIDVVVTLSGIFRDLLPLQTRLLAEAALLAAQAEESPEQNFIRKHALAFIAEHGGAIEDAALRVFSNQDGAYGANVNQMIETSAWEDEAELGRAYLARKGFAYGVDGKPARHDAVLAQVLGTVAAAYQNLESLELGVTSVDHYFDGLGGLTRAIGAIHGNAAQPALYIGDQTRGEGKIRTLSEQVALEIRTRTLNPKYIEDLLAHGHEGVRQIEAQVTNALGWSATTGSVEPWIYRQITETFVLDEAMRERLAKLNPTASARLTSRLIEAQERSYWNPDAATLAALHEAGEAAEDRLEGIGRAA